MLSLTVILLHRFSVVQLTIDPCKNILELIGKTYGAAIGTGRPKPCSRYQGQKNHQYQRRRPAELDSVTWQFFRSVLTRLRRCNQTP